MKLLLKPVLYIPLLVAICIPKSEDDILLDALEQVESGGDIGAVGDRGRALGPLQLHKSFWLDALQYAGKKNEGEWKYIDNVWSRSKSRQIVKWYWKKYKCKTRLEKVCAFHWGPKGAQYARKVEYYYRRCKMSAVRRRKGKYEGRR